MLNEWNTEDQTHLFISPINDNVGTLSAISSHTVSLFCSINFLLENVHIFSVRSYEIFYLQWGEL